MSKVACRRMKTARLYLLAGVAPCDVVLAVLDSFLELRVVARDLPKTLREVSRRAAKDPFCDMRQKLNSRHGTNTFLSIAHLRNTP